MNLASFPAETGNTIEAGDDWKESYGVDGLSKHRLVPSGLGLTGLDFPAIFRLFGFSSK